jgi:hypothetical protein
MLGWRTAFRVLLKKRIWKARPCSSRYGVDRQGVLSEGFAEHLAEHFEEHLAEHFLEGFD